MTNRDIDKNFQDVNKKLNDIGKIFDQQKKSIASIGCLSFFLSFLLSLIVLFASLLTEVLFICIFINWYLAPNIKFVPNFQFTEIFVVWILLVMTYNFLRPLSKENPKNLFKLALQSLFKSIVWGFLAWGLLAIYFFLF